MKHETSIMDESKERIEKIQRVVLREDSPRLIDASGPVNRSRRTREKEQRLESGENRRRRGFLHASLISRLTFRPTRSLCTRSNGPRTIFRLACYRWNFWISESLSIREKCAEKETSSLLIAIIIYLSKELTFHRSLCGRKVYDEMIVEI